MKYILLFATFSMIGCATATMVSPVGGSKSKYAPSNESSRSGTIRYLNQGAQTIIDARREDAYKQMYEACGGQYKIMTEGPREEGGAARSIGSTTFFDSYQYWYITFQCN